MTRVEAMEICKELVVGREDAEEITAILDKCIESFSKKSVSKADKEKAAENVVITDAVKNVLANGEKMKIGDITKAVNAMLNADYSSQRVQYQTIHIEDIQNEKNSKGSYYFM